MWNLILKVTSGLFRSNNNKFLMGQSRPLFFIFVISIVNSTNQLFFLKIADGWIQTWVLWCLKQPLCCIFANT